jgi:pimeloyl-ACP methyl ester carboxylesterase
VLSVDHPGYGLSPPPNTDGDVEDWDPRRTGLAALRVLSIELGYDRIVLVGHSMGNREVLRLLEDSRAGAGFLLGAAFRTDPPSRDDYWYDRFHQTRRLTDRVSRPEWRRIVDAYYSTRSLVASLGVDHQPVVLTHFGFEWGNVRAGRDSLAESLPGRKTVYHLRASTHYLSSFQVWRYLIADTRVTRRLSQQLQTLAGQMN